MNIGTPVMVLLAERPQEQGIVVAIFPRAVAYRTGGGEYRFAEPNRVSPIFPNLPSPAVRTT